MIQTIRRNSGTAYLKFNNKSCDKYRYTMYDVAERVKKGRSNINIGRWLVTSSQSTVRVRVALQKEAWPKKKSISAKKFLLVLN